MLDGALAKVGGMDMRLPYPSDPNSRAHLNDGEMADIDIHLSHVAQTVWFGFLGKLNVAVIEVANPTCAATRPRWSPPSTRTCPTATRAFRRPTKLPSASPGT